MYFACFVGLLERVKVVCSLIAKHEYGLSILLPSPCFRKRFCRQAFVYFACFVVPLERVKVVCSLIAKHEYGLSILLPSPWFSRKFCRQSFVYFACFVVPLERVTGRGCERLSFNKSAPGAIPEGCLTGGSAFGKLRETVFRREIIKSRDATAPYPSMPLHPKAKTMIRTLFLLLILLIPMVSLVQAAEFTPIFEESFDKELMPGWSWLRESPGKWKLVDGGLEILMEPEHGNAAKNVLWRKAPDRSAGVWAIEVTITSKSQPTNQYEQTGIYWLQNDKLVFKFVKERIDGKVYVFPGKKPLNAKTVQLRLIVEGDKVTAQYRPNAPKANSSPRLKGSCQSKVPIRSAFSAGTARPIASTGFGLMIFGL